MGFRSVKVQSGVALGVALAQVGSAWAVPTAFPQDRTSLAGFVNNTSSSVVADTEDPRFAWVLPPNSGVAKADRLFSISSSNIRFCEEMADLQDYSREISAEAHELSKLIKAKLPEKERRHKEYLRLLALAEAVYQQNPNLQPVKEIEDRIEAIEARLSSLYPQLETCRDRACDLISAEISDLQKESRQLKAQVIPLRVRAGEAYTRYLQAKRRSDAALTAYQEVTASIKSIRDDLDEVSAGLFASYGRFGQLEGGFTSIVYDSHYNENMERLRADNPGFRIEKIMTANTRVNATFIAPSETQESYLAGLPAVLDYTVNGKPYRPWGDQTDQELAAFPSRMGATLRLSLVGACPFYIQDRFKEIARDNAGLPAFSISSTYEFPLAFRTKVKFAYNLYKVYSLIKESGSKGGLFSSRSWQSTTEATYARDGYSVDWTVEDPADPQTEEQRRQIETEVKAELTERVLKMMATPVVNGGSQADQAPPVPTSGVIVLANGLSATCGWYSYWCAGGSWVLRGLGAIFGSSRTEQSFKQIHDIRAEQEWSKTQTRMKPGITVFVTKGE